MLCLRQVSYLFAGGGCCKIQGLRDVSCSCCSQSARGSATLLVEGAPRRKAGDCVFRTACAVMHAASSSRFTESKIRNAKVEWFETKTSTRVLQQLYAP